MNQNWGTRPRVTPIIVAIGAAAFAVGAGFSALIGWALEIPRLTDLMNQGISMFPNTALCGVFVGTALILFAQFAEPRAISARRVLAVATVSIAGLTLFEHVAGFNLGIDTLLFDRPWGQAAAAAPMRMGVPASISFIILGTAMWLVSLDPKARAAASTLALATMAIAALSLTGYWYSANQLFGIARLTGIAWQTSAVIAALSVGIIALVPEYGLTALLHRNDPGGAVFRQLLWPIIVIPFVLGWFRLYGQELGLYDTAFGTALRTLVEIALFFALLWWTANSISRQAVVAQHAQARLAAIVQSSDDAIVSKSLKGIVESWNEGAERVFGYSAGEIIGRSITLIIPPERIDEEASIIARLKQGQRIEHFETVRVRKDGTRVNVSLTVSPVYDADGRMIGASKIARDIGDRLRAEQRFRTVVDANPECVMIVALDGALEFLNDAGLRMVESDSMSSVHHRPAFDFVTPEHREEWIRRHERVCNGESLSWEFELVGLQGTHRWMETYAVPLPLDDGRIAQLAVARDITLRKQFESEREVLLESERAARSEAEQASYLKDEFLATLSHELRTPLNAILGWSQLLTMTSGEQDLAQGLDAIQRNARAQAQLIEDLLDMSRILSGKVRLDVQSIELSSVIQSAIESIAPAAEAKGIRMRKVLDSSPGMISGDPARLQQIVWNLLTNAIKFTPKGGSVDIILQRVNSHIEITVHDTGIGITSESLAIIFERFRQVDSSTTRSYGGLGLGLSIVKHLVELHGGTVMARSEGEGQGSTFIVRLPLSAVRHNENNNHPLTGDSAAVSNDVNLDGVKVLVVDDEPDARTIIQRVLAQCGADVVSASSAAEALDRFRAFRPHVIVSDIGMPTRDGYQLIRDVRSLTESEGGTTPAVALTAFARSEDRMRAMMSGFQVHVAKPIEPQELAVTVHAMARRGSSAASW